MQYTILKTIIETSLGQFACQNCQEKLDIEHLAIQSISDTSVDLDLTCPRCGAHTLMHAEVGSAQVGDFVPPGKHEIRKIITKNDHAIKDDDIATIEQNLKNNTSVEDLLR